MGGTNDIVRGKFENSEKRVQFNVVQLLRPFLHYHYDVCVELCQFSYCSSWIVPTLLFIHGDRTTVEFRDNYSFTILHSTIKRRFESKKYMS